MNSNNTSFFKCSVLKNKIIIQYMLTEYSHL